MDSTRHGGQRFGYDAVLWWDSEVRGDAVQGGGAGMGHLVLILLLPLLKPFKRWK